jgi:hypothetical protein
VSWLFLVLWSFVNRSGFVVFSDFLELSISKVCARETHMYKHANAYMYKHTHVQHTNMHMYKHTQVLTHTLTCKHTHVQHASTHMCNIQTHTHTHTHTHVYNRTHTHTHTHCPLQCTASSSLPPSWTLTNAPVLLWMWAATLWPSPTPNSTAVQAAPYTHR